MTTQLCADACRKAGYSLAGVEAAYGCACGNSFDPKHPNPTAKMPDSQCCSPCAGDPTRKSTCGDKLRIFVFNVSECSSTLSTCGHNSACPKPQPTPKPTPAPPPHDMCFDRRSMCNGSIMLKAGYLDQPYCAVSPTSGRWLCTITANSRPEGSSGEHIAAIWSDDAGKTWSDPVVVEPAPNATSLANAYSMTAIASGIGAGGADRAYAIYNMNTQNITEDGPGGIGHITRTGSRNMQTF